MRAHRLGRRALCAGPASVAFGRLITLVGLGMFIARLLAVLAKQVAA